jgi:tetratricopeptide (TPR) repeat protein
MKNKTVAAVLAFFLGMWGVHRFYLGQKFLGFLYFFFFWMGFIATVEEGGAPFFLPVVILAFIDSILLAVKPEEEFDATYNKKKLLERRPGVRKGTSVTLADFKAEGVRFFREHDYECALDAFLDALDLAPDDPTVHFNLACAYARLHELPDTLHHLELAIDYGFDRKERLDNHPAFDWIRNQPEWQEFKINDYRVEPQAFPRESDVFSSQTTAPQHSRPTPADAPAPDLPTEEPDSLEQFDLLEQIARLGELRNRGVLTDEEFARQKEKLLN